MGLDAAQRQLDERVRAASPGDLMRLHEGMYRLAFRQVWAQADRAGPMTPLALTRFLLERLYPDLRGERLDRIMERFAELERDGDWTGPSRPED